MSRDKTPFSKNEAATISLTVAVKVEVAEGVWRKAALVEEVVDGEDAASAEVDARLAVLGGEDGGNQSSVPVVGDKHHILAVGLALHRNLRRACTLGFESCQMIAAGKHGEGVLSAWLTCRGASIAAKVKREKRNWLSPNSPWASP